MEIANLVMEAVRGFTGQKSAIPHGMLQASDAEKVENFVTRRARLRKIWGSSLYANVALPSGAGRVSWLGYIRHFFAYQQGNSIALEQTEGAGDFQEAGSILLGDQSKIFSDKWLNNLYLSNGCENKFLEYAPQIQDAIGLRNLGLIPPGRGLKSQDGSDTINSVSISKVASVGSTLADATYGYVVTWWDANRRVESLPNGSSVGDDGFWNSFGAVAAIDSQLAFVGMADNAVQVDIKSLKDQGYDADRVTHFIVYRFTQADYFTLKRVADPDNVADEANLRIANDFYNDTTVEADLGKVLDESLSPPPSGLYYQGLADPAKDQGLYGPRFVKYFRGQLWLFGANYPGQKNSVTSVQVPAFFTPDKPLPGEVSLKGVPVPPQNGWAYTSEAGNFDYWKFSWDIARNTGQDDTGLAVHRGTLLFFKSGSVHYLSGTSTNDYVVIPLDTKRGVVAPGSLQETSKGPIGLSADCFALFDSISGGKPISDEVADEVLAINLDFVEQITSAYDPKEEKYECHVPLDAAGYNQKVFVYDLKTGVMTFHRRAGGAAHYALNSKNRVVGLLGDARNGRVYDVSNYAATDFAGQKIRAFWRSKAFDFGRPEAMKGLQRVIITARATRDFKVSIDVIPDFNEGDCQTLEDISPDVRNDDFDDAAPEQAFDAARWDAETTKKKFTILVQCIGRNIQLVVRNAETDADAAQFEIEEILLEASLLDGSNDD
jgi:hypothetical protein